MRPLNLLTALLLAVAVVGCGGNSSGSKTHRGSAASAVQAPTKERTLTRIDIAPQGDVVLDDRMGAAFQILVDGHYQDMTGRVFEGDLSREAEYEVADSTVAKITGSGLITPVGVGQTTITARMRAKSGAQLVASRTVKVVAATSTRPSFVAIDVLPAARTLWGVDQQAHLDDYQQLLVLATDANGRQHDLTRSLAIRVQDPAGKRTNLASVDTLGLMRGRVQGQVVAVARLDALGLRDGAAFTLGVSPASPIDPNTLYGGYPLAGSGNPIDQAVLAGLMDRMIEPAPLSEDGEFLRRLYADALGRAPTLAELDAFRQSRAPDKRAREIDRVLARPELATYWASIMGEWLQLPRKVTLAGTKSGNYDFTTTQTLTVIVDGGAPQSIVLQASMFSDPTNVFSGAVVPEINKQLQGAIAFRIDNFVHLINAETGPGTSLQVAAGGAGDTLGLSGKSGVVIDTWAESSLLAGKSLRRMFRELSEGQVAAFEAIHSTAAQKVDVLILSGAGHTARCAKCHDHPLSGPGDTIGWSQDERYPLDAFFATNAAEATKLDGKTGLRFDPPKEPGFVLDPQATVNTTLADPLAARRAEFGQVFTSSDAFMRGLGHRIFAQIVTPLLDPNQFLQRNVDGVQVPDVFDAVAATFRAQNTSLQGFLRVVFGSRTYQLSSCAENLDPLNDVFLQRRTLRMRFAEAVDHSLEQVTGAAISGRDKAYLHQTFGYPEERLTITERQQAVNTSQALLLLNSPVVQDRIKAVNGLVADLTIQVVGLRMSKQEAVRRLFRAGLSRDPSAVELNDYMDLINQAPSVKEGLEDAAAATVGLVEFGLN